MSVRTASWLAWSLCTLGLAVLAASLVLILLGWSTPQPRGEPPWWHQAVSVVGVIGAPIVGGLIASRRPGNPYGWLWLGFGLGLALQQLGGTYATYALVVGFSPLLVAPYTISHLLGLGGTLALVLAPFLLLLFPTGRLPSRRWRALAWVSAICGTVLLALNFIYTRPDEVKGVIGVITVLVATPVMASIVLSAISLIFRYRRTSGTEHQQLKWFALAAALIGIYVIGGGVLGYERLLNKGGWTLLEAATSTVLYLAVGVAILRYRLYDIDVIINRALVYGPLTAALVALYFGGIVVLQRLFVTLTGQQSTLAIVASTLVIAALFSPLRRRIQKFIDRRFYRSKYDARKTLDTFSDRLRNEIDVKSLNDDLVGVVGNTMQPEHVTLWLRTDPAAETTEAKNSR
jgi:hypothetical protein